MKGDLIWPIVHVVVRRVVPLLVAALLGILADAGLLDGELSDRAAEVLERSESSLLLPARNPYPAPTWLDTA